MEAGGSTSKTHTGKPSAASAGDEPRMMVSEPRIKIKEKPRDPAEDLGTAGLQYFSPVERFARGDTGMAGLDYLVVAPHPDDAELGAAGAILLLKSQGASVGVLDLTDGEPTPHGSREIRRREADKATALLGLDWRDNLGLPNRSLLADLDARARLAGVLRKTRPRILFAPYWEDAHPDHVAASALVDAARFWAKLTNTDLPGEPHYPQRIIYYFSVHLRLHVRPSLVLDITAHIDAKMRAIACYESQFITGRPVEPPTFLDDLRDRARYWGWTIGAGYGEPFLCREEIGLRSLRDLV
jgi:bacillithiol biosynthesis deacetylase BshB1